MVLHTSTPLTVACVLAAVAALGASDVDDIRAPPPTAVDRDHAIASSMPPMYLNAAWGLQHRSAGVPSGPRLTATVPGDILTDLQRARVIDDPYFNTSWRDPSFIAAWNNGTWTYEATFDSPAPTAASRDPDDVAGPAGGSGSVLLVFDGIRMGAMIELNGVLLGNATDAWLRYEFVIANADLRPTGNLITVRFGAELGIATGGRFTLSESIDWAPVMLTREPTSKRPTFGFGITKSVYVLSLPSGAAAIRHFVPHTFYAGGHPIALLSDADHAGFSITARVDLLAGALGAAGTVTVLGEWPGAVSVSRAVILGPGANSSVTLELSADQTRAVRLWYPHGHGDQIRYNITASFTPHPQLSNQQQPGAATTTRKIGFRHIALCTTDDTDPSTHSAKAKENGTGQRSMFLRVNGAPVYARGANKVPMDLLEGRLTAAGHRRLVQSAVEGNMNMLRIWGGGIWEPRSFFDACDEFGVLLYADLQFGAKSNYTLPGGRNFNTVVPAELEHQISRNSHHPAIALWDGCNECGLMMPGRPANRFAELGMKLVAQIDKSRPIWPSSPASGWESGVDRLSTRPNGQPLVVGVGSGSVRPPLPDFPWFMESHGPYGGLWTEFRGHRGYISDTTMPVATRSAVEDSCLGLCSIHANSDWGPLGPSRGPAECTSGVCTPFAVPQWTGPGQLGWFKSEFGQNVWSSFESMSPQLPEGQWGMNSAAAAQRNHNVSSVIGTYFGVAAVTEGMQEVGEAAFKRQLYQSMIAQLLWMKVTIESYRSSNGWGTIFWMYNEIWPTGGWGSIEYGSDVPGQVVGGRMKPLHHELFRSAFADQLAACNTAGACWVNNDAPFAFEGVVMLRVVNIMMGASVAIQNRTVSLGAGARVTQWFCATAAHVSEDVGVTGSTSSTGGRRGLDGTARSAPYLVHPNQLPSNRNGFYAIVDRGSNANAECEAACSRNATCVGFTEDDRTRTRCWLYGPVPSLTDHPGDSFYQKPRTSPIPAPPAPPAPPPSPPSPSPPSPPRPGPVPVPPSQLPCITWPKTVAWQRAGCSADGADCALVIDVTDGNGSTVSHNVSPFLAPKGMRLPKANVTATVESWSPSTHGSVPVTVRTTATALFVVLTTQAPGRFSDNGFLIERGETRTVEFVAWAPLDATAVALLKGSLRVEHLADNLSA